MRFHTLFNRGNPLNISEAARLRPLFLIAVQMFRGFFYKEA